MLVADRHTLFRAGVRLLFESEPDLEVSAEAASLAELREALAATKVDVVLCDLDLADSPRDLLADPAINSSVKWVALSGAEDPEAAARAADAGALGLVQKGASSFDLAQAVRAVRCGLRWDASRKPASQDDPSDLMIRHAPADLTPREEEVSDLVAQGLPYREVAARLGISEHTVRNHIRKVFQKLGIHSRLELVVTANDGAPAPSVRSSP